MQTNTVMSERLYELAIEYADLRPDDVVWDLYCGAGAIGLLAAARAGSVYGIEIARGVGRRARENAERNGLSNIEFVTGDVAKSVAPLLERAPRPDVVFVDPPRAGLTPKAVRRVVELAPERLVYVSCNPTTLAPNARALVDAGIRWSASGRWTCSRTRPTSSASPSSAAADRTGSGTEADVRSRSARRIRARPPRAPRAQRSTEPRSTHSSTACAPAPDGPKTTVGMPAAERTAASIQAAWPIEAGSVPRTTAAARRTVTTIGADGSDLERRPLEGRARPRRSPAIAAHLRPRRPRAPRPGPSAARVRSEAALRIARELLAALDQRGVHRARPEQRVWARREPASSRESPTSTPPIAAIASTPRSGREPWAATPAVSTSSHTNPLWATTPRARSAR